MLGGVVQVPFFPTQDGKDGWVTSAGMLILRSMLLQIPGISFYTTNWGNYLDAYRDVAAVPADVKRVVIGYSGGGTRATYLADTKPYQEIDLMILYDPSPEWQMMKLWTNVKQVVCFHNLKPMMPSPYGPLGGGSVTLAPGNDVTKVSTKNIAEQHLLVQKNMALHRQTVNLVKALIQ
jgi:hypothetical protein